MRSPLRRQRCFRPPQLAMVAAFVIGVPSSPPDRSSRAGGGMGRIRNEGMIDRHCCHSPCSPSLTHPYTTGSKCAPYRRLFCSIRLCGAPGSCLWDGNAPATPPPLHFAPSSHALCQPDRDEPGRQPNWSLGGDGDDSPTMTFFLPILFHARLIIILSGGGFARVRWQARSGSAAIFADPDCDLQKSLIMSR